MKRGQEAGKKTKVAGRSASQPPSKRAKSETQKRSVSQSPGRPTKKTPAKSPGRPRKASQSPPRKRARSAGSPNKTMSKSPARRRPSSKSPGRPKKAAAKSPGRPKKAASQSPGRGRKAAKSPGRPKKAASQSPGRGRKAAKSPGRPTKAASHSPGIGRKAAKSPRRPMKAASQSPGRGRKSVKSPGRPKKFVSQSPGRGRKAAKSPGMPTKAASQSAGRGRKSTIKSPGRPKKTSSKSPGPSPKAVIKSPGRPKGVKSPGRFAQSPKKSSPSKSPSLEKKASVNLKDKSPKKSVTVKSFYGHPTERPGRVASQSPGRGRRAGSTEKKGPRQSRKDQAMKVSASPARRFLFKDSPARASPKAKVKKVKPSPRVKLNIKPIVRKQETPKKVELVTSPRRSRPSGFYRDLLLGKGKGFGSEESPKQPAKKAEVTPLPKSVKKVISSPAKKTAPKGSPAKKMLVKSPVKTVRSPVKEIQKKPEKKATRIGTPRTVFKFPVKSVTKVSPKKEAGKITPKNVSGKVDSSSPRARLLGARRLSPRITLEKVPVKVVQSSSGKSIIVPRSPIVDKRQVSPIASKKDSGRSRASSAPAKPIVTPIKHSTAEPSKETRFTPKIAGSEKDKAKQSARSQSAPARKEKAKVAEKVTTKTRKKGRMMVKMEFKTRHLSEKSSDEEALLKEQSRKQKIVEKEKPTAKKMKGKEVAEKEKEKEVEKPVVNQPVVNDNYLVMKESLRVKASSGGFLNLAKFSEAIHSKRKIYVPTIADLTRDTPSRRGADTANRPVTCLDCGIIVPNRYKLIDHKLQCSSVGQAFVFACFECHCAFRTRHELQEHKRSNHTQTMPQMDVTGSTIKAVVGKKDARLSIEICLCQVCNKVCMSTTELELHMESTHKKGGKRFSRKSSGSPGKTASTPVSLARATSPRQKNTPSSVLTKEQKDALRPKSKNIRFLCLECGLDFGNKPLLIEHKLTHQPGYKPPKHKEANNIFEKMSLNKSPENASPTTNVIRTTTITKTSPIKVARPRVIRPYISDEEKQKKIRFLCMECNMTFTEREDLVAHRKSNTCGIDSNKALNCSECNLTFKRWADITSHKKKYHQDVLTCKYCGTWSGTAKTLSIHISKKHEGGLKDPQVTPPSQQVKSPPVTKVVQFSQPVKPKVVQLYQPVKPGARGAQQRAAPGKSSMATADSIKLPLASSSAQSFQLSKEELDRILSGGHSKLKEFLVKNATTANKVSTSDLQQDQTVKRVELPLKIADKGGTVSVVRQAPIGVSPSTTKPQIIVPKAPQPKPIPAVKAQSSLKPAPAQAQPIPAVKAQSPPKPASAQAQVQQSKVSPGKLIVKTVNNTQYEVSAQANPDSSNIQISITRLDSNEEHDVQSQAQVLSQVLSSLLPRMQATSTSPPSLVVAAPAPPKVASAKALAEEKSIAPRKGKQRVTRARKKLTTTLESSQKTKDNVEPEQESEPESEPEPERMTRRPAILRTSNRKRPGAKPAGKDMPPSKTGKVAPKAKQNESSPRKRGRPVSVESPTAGRMSSKMSQRQIFSRRLTQTPDTARLAQKQAAVKTLQRTSARASQKQTSTRGSQRSVLSRGAHKPSSPHKSRMAVSKLKPTPKAQKPTPKVQKSVPKAQKPVYKVQKPVPKTQKPVPKVQKPARKAQKPVHKAQKPAPKAQKPAPKAQKPVPKVQKPAPKAQKPVPKVQKPAPKPESPRAKVAKPESPRTKVARPESPRAKVARPESPRAKVTKPESPRAKVTKPESPRATVIRPESPRAKVVRPESPRAKLAKPASPRAKVVRPESPKTITKAASPRALARPGSPARGSPRPSSPRSQSPRGSPRARTLVNSPLKNVTDSPLRFRCSKCMETFFSVDEYQNHTCKELPKLAERRSNRESKKTEKFKELEEAWKLKRVTHQEEPNLDPDDHVEWLVAEMNEDDDD